MNVILAEILKWLALLGFLYIVYDIWRRLNTLAEKEKQQALGGSNSEDSQKGDQPNSEGNEGSKKPLPEEMDTRHIDWKEIWGESENDRKERQLKEILKRDPTLADDIKRLANIDDSHSIDDPETIKEIADRLSDRTLHILDVVSKKPILDIDLESKTRLQETNAGGVYQQPRNIRDLSEVPKMRPVEWAMPDSLRRYRMLTGQSKRLQRYEIVQDKKKFIVLEDASGSMIQYNLHGLPRFYWSRGTIANLARQAVAGNTEFVYHQFHDIVLPGVSVKTKEEATEFLEWAISISPTTGGTNIYNAIKEGVKNAKGDELLEILLITDGEDESINDTSKVKRLLNKGNIRLHVIVIGGDNNSLKKVATSYQTVK